VALGFSAALRPGNEPLCPSPGRDIDQKGTDMIKQLTIAACLSLPLLGMAADAAAPAATPASAAVAPAVSKTSQGELKAQQGRGAKMGACQKQADEKALNGLERKKFLGECVKA